MLQPAWIVSPGQGAPREASHCDRFKDDIESCCAHGHHRKLAVCSILCGCPWLGILALINSVKAEHTGDPEDAARCKRRARIYGIFSIMAMICSVGLSIILVAVALYQVYEETLEEFHQKVL